MFGFSLLKFPLKTGKGRFQEGKCWCCNIYYYSMGASTYAINIQHTDLSAKYGGQQGHADVHAILCLAEICCSGVGVHLHTERDTQNKTSERVKNKRYDPETENSEHSVGMVTQTKTQVHLVVNLKV